MTELIKRSVSGDHATVGVIITTFNHARFLADAITSVLAQTRQPDKIIVVDDGSADDPTAVVADFPGVRMIRQRNRGLAAARNTGLQNCATTHVVFLDADDRVLPTALEAGLACAAKRSECAFVYGGYRHISEDLGPRGGDSYYPIIGDAHLALLRGNRIAMHATVLYRRDCLMEVGGFNEALRRCEDYDLYLRIAQKYLISSHEAIVAEYRLHSENMSGDAVAMLRAALSVLDRHESRIIVGAPERAALREGRAFFRDYYVSRMLDPLSAQARASRGIGAAVKGLIQATWWSPRIVVGRLVRFVRSRVRKVLPPAVVRRIERLRGRPESFPLGSARFGDLRRLAPISRTFGFDRGTPVDRYYIERFLAENAGDIRGRVLEIGDNVYTQRFGAVWVEQSDILHVATNPRATLIGDLARLDVLPAAAFDCIVLTQTLHFVFDMRAAVATLHQALKPGGVLLTTTPGISPVDRGEWGKTWYWSLTAPAVRSLLAERFRLNDIAVEAHGNVFAATAFLYGLALEELKQADLDVNDESFPVIVAARAVKAENA
jgi:glycosyltransferase involved in cell wall biosynthesis